MTATADKLVADLQRANAELQRQLDERTAELREKNERYALVSQAVAEGVYDWNVEQNTLFVSSRLMEIFGFDGTGLTSQDWFARVHAAEREAYRTALRDCFKGGSPKVNCEYRVLVESGEYRWVEDHGLPIRNEAGRAIRLVGAVSDVTERKKADDALRETTRLKEVLLDDINAVIDTIDYGVLFMGSDLRARVINRAFRQMWGIPDAFIATRPTMADLINYNRHTGLYDVPEAEFDAFLARRVEAIQSGNIGSVEMRRADDKILRYEGVVLPDGGRLLTYLDITGSKRRQAELSESLAQQTATAEVLGVINSSPGDLKPVFEAILEKAHTLCDAPSGSLQIYDGEQFRAVATRGLAEPFAAILRQGFRIDPDDPYMVNPDRVVQIPDGLRAVAHLAPDNPNRLGMELAGTRTVLFVPLHKDNVFLGRIVAARLEVRPFSDKQIALLQNFAAQAVIAMENARLITETREARYDAEAALSNLRAAQANLIQAEKMASLGQLTAGIAHEIKNPLNFVNNFASLSVELLEELRETTAPAVAALDEKKRAEVGDTMEMLTGNLEKIAEHGKRADNIVKSMLEHSRGGSGERREVDLNGVIEEALKLAYHGARAQDQGFNITLECDFASALKPIELAPQEMTRVFLNLFGNGFYAVNKRVRENGEGSFRPTLTVATRDLGDAVEVRIRDNGTGIPADIKDKLFQPFFTTKPTGEGTGLGLSISYDIVTQQHGGTIEVESEVGAYTEFTIRLPRGGAAPTGASA